MGKEPGAGEPRMADVAQDLELSEEDRVDLERRFRSWRRAQSVLHEHMSPDDEPLFKLSWPERP